MTWEVLQADCIEALGAMPDESIDAIVTDPPAGISFMSKGWDHDKGGRDAWVAWLAEVMAECLRVAKPGAHALVWALPRTSHWTGWAIEEAGWEVRDRIAHHFGSGFPKSLAVDKAIDRAATCPACGGSGEGLGGLGTEPCRGCGGTGRPKREVVGATEHYSENRKGGFGKATGNFHDDNWVPPEQSPAGLVTAPATSEAQRWQGWGTALKPATEDWWLCRKPLIGTVAETVTKFGTGALNIDATRIEHGRDVKDDRRVPVIRQQSANPLQVGGAKPGDVVSRYKDGGRWPSNVVLSHLPECEPVGERRVKSGTAVRHNKGIVASSNVTFNADAPEQTEDVTFADADGLETVEAWRCVEGCPVRELDLQSGERPSHGAAKWSTLAGNDGRVAYGDYGPTEGNFYGDTGGASRFFATFHDREEQHESDADVGGGNTAPLSREASKQGVEPGVSAVTADVSARFLYTAKASRAERNAGLGGERKLRLRSDLEPDQVAYVTEELRKAGVDVD